MALSGTFLRRFAFTPLLRCGGWLVGLHSSTWKLVDFLTTGKWKVISITLGRIHILQHKLNYGPPRPPSASEEVVVATTEPTPGT